MASLAQLQADVASYLNRSDFIAQGIFPGWVLSVETELAQTLRVRAMEVSAYQNIDAPYISLPSDFATMASIRDGQTGELLHLEDEWTGSWTEAWPPSPYSAYAEINPAAPSRSYRIVAACIEFLPHPIIPDPPDPSWVPQQVLMAYYAKPRPLLLPTDTNSILEAHYSIYLWGLLKEGALWALDDARAQQADAKFQQLVTRADLWTQQSSLSGAPLREQMAWTY